MAMNANRGDAQPQERRSVLVVATAIASAALTALLLPLSGGALAQAAPANTAPPVITGTAAKGQTLVASTGTWTGTAPIGFAFQWQRCDSAGANCSAISGATNTTYVLGDDDVGRRMRILVTASNAEGTASALSDATDTVTGDGKPKNEAEPTISGSLVAGQTLTATTGTWSGTQPITFAFQWVRCGSDGGAPDGSNCTFIGGATGTTYVLTSSDVGGRMRVRVTATNSAGVETVASNATAVVTGGGAPVNTKEPTISGSPVAGQRLTATTGTWSGTQPITFTYQWVRCGTDGGAPDGSNCAATGGNGSSYILRSSDVGGRMRVRVTAKNSAGTVTRASNPTAVVRAGGAPVNTKRPSVTATWVEGQVARVDRGTWTGATSFSYQWLRCNSAGGGCAAISGATSTTYRLTSADVGRKVRVNVTARNSAGSTTVLSTESGTVAASGSAGERSIPVTSVPNTERLIVDRVQFTPSPVRSRVNPIVVRVRVKDTRGFVVSGAIVFVRSTPLVTRAVRPRQPTQTDGWITFQMTPRSNFPKLKNGAAIQFFVKAYRNGDPPLAGIAGYRLVQVKLRT